MGARVPRRKSTVPVNRARFAGGSGDTAHTLRANRLVPPRRDGEDSRPDAGDRPYAHVPAPELEEGEVGKVIAEIPTASQRKPSYFLFPISYFLAPHTPAVRRRT